ncbi:hypothetical protein G6011_07420 [Alternaria panax]|uniref:Uncharacterized protein n=1 Tax=Alternaria panax TaxID=48097 RepID=A0AAD4I4Q1_9PLEO|nr:hypothetical protein G6011_07420 [Alternaria panax]
MVSEDADLPPPSQPTTFFGEGISTQPTTKQPYETWVDPMEKTPSEATAFSISLYSRPPATKATLLRTSTPSIQPRIGTSVAMPKGLLRQTIRPNRRAQPQRIGLPPPPAPRDALP